MAVNNPLHEPGLNADPGQPESQEGVPGKGGWPGLTTVFMSKLINIWLHAKGLPTAVIQPKKLPGVA